MPSKTDGRDDGGVSPDVAVDIPRLSDARSVDSSTVDSLNVASLLLKGDLNASFRGEDADALRSRSVGNVRVRADSFTSRTSSRSGGSTSGGSGLSSAGGSGMSKSSGGSGGGRKAGGAGRSKGKGGGKNKKSKKKSRSSYKRKCSVEADHVDVPYLDESGLRRSFDDSQERDSPADAAAGAGRHAVRWDEKSMGGGNHEKGGGRGKKSPDKGGKGGAIIVEDEEEVRGDNPRAALDRFKKQGTSMRSLNLEMPTLSEMNKSRSTSFMFESLWSVGRSEESDDSDDMIGDRSTRSRSDGTVGLMRNTSGSVRLGRSGGYDAPPPRRSGEGGRFGNCCGFFASHLKTSLLCIVTAIGFAITVGLFVVMIPIWMESGERGESGEFGEMGGEGVLMDMEAMSSESFKPPPYNLQLLCSQDSLSKQGGYDKCRSACLPSRCCLVPEGKPYRVWTTMQHGDESLPIGAVLPSCFNKRRDMCVRYNSQCSALETSALLPRRPPDDAEVAAMSDGDMLRLAELVHHSCSSKVGAEECPLLCAGKECCFAEEDEGGRRAADVTEDGPPAEGAAVGSLRGGRRSERASERQGGDRRLSEEVNERRGAIELGHMKIPGEEDFTYVIPEDGSFAGMGMETNAYRPREEEEERGTEGGATVGGPESNGAPPLSGSPGEVEDAPPKPPQKNCLSDPNRHCMTYAGCAPLFGR